MNEYTLDCFGGIADGIFDNSESFSRAFQCIREAGAGTLRVTQGVWRTGPLELFSHTTLILDKGAILSFIPDPLLYRPVRTRWEGVECYAMHPCVFASGQHDITISGQGILDGSGRYWWDIAREKKSRPQTKPETPLEMEFARLNRNYAQQPGGGGGRASQFLRPPLVQFYDCSNIRLQGIQICNSPFWTVHPVYCSGLVISGITVSNPHDAPNTDGIDIDSCEDVLIEDCYLSVGDDGIAIKSGSGEDGIKVGKPCRRITVRACTVEDGHGGIVIGSETAAGIFDIATEDCLFRGTDRGIRIKTRRGRGGRIENLSYKNLTMENNLCPLAINMFYRCGADSEDNFYIQEALPLNDATPSVRNIYVSDIHASGCRASAGFIAGLPESPVENISIQRCTFSTDEHSGISPDESDMFMGLPQVTEKSIRLINVKKSKFSEINVHGPAQAFIYR